MKRNYVPCPHFELRSDKLGDAEEGDIANCHNRRGVEISRTLLSCGNDFDLCEERKDNESDDQYSGCRITAGNNRPEWIGSLYDGPGRVE